MRQLQKLLVAAFLFLSSPMAFGYSNEFSPLRIPLEGFRPSYFLYGNPDSKVQVSFKVELVQHSNFFFAYSQLMFWDLKEASAPFRDLNYNPELFYRVPFADPKDFIDLGVEHESNGKAGEDSRSWNRLYVRVAGPSDILKSPKLNASAKVWFAQSNKDTNADIQRYRGVYEINLTATNFLGKFADRHDATFRIYGGGSSTLNPLGGGQELTFRFIPSIGSRTAPMITLQVFNGYGESLLDYKSRRTIFRAGVGF